LKRLRPLTFSLLFLITTGIAPVRAGITLDGRRWAPLDQGLLDRLVIGRYMKNDVMDVIRLTSTTRSVGVKALYYRGEALRSLGLFSRAAEAYAGAIAAKSPEEPLWNASLVRYIQLMGSMPGLPPPPVPPDLDGRITDKTALYLGSLLLREGKGKRAIALFESVKKDGTDQSALATAAIAQSYAALNRWEDSASILASFKTTETTPITDLIYLLRGYDYLESGNLKLARSSFLALPPSSPYAPEALHGQSWVLIRRDDLTGAAVRLQELIYNYPDSPAARKGVIDLALCYRELGLYSNAAQLLTRESKHLTEVRVWLGSLQASDFKPGSDLIVLLGDALRGMQPDPEILNKTPGFILQWLIQASRDPQVRWMSTLIEGGEKLLNEAGRLREKSAGSVELLQREIRFTEKQLQETKETRVLLQSALTRLPSFRKDVIQALERNSLKDFAPKEALKLLTRIRASQERLESVTANAGKVRGFYGIIDSIKSSIPASGEEEQINRIRKNAYEGLVSSRSSLRRIRSSLQALEGRVWLIAKGEAMNFERESSSRVSREMSLISLLRRKNEKAVSLLLERRDRLLQARDDLNHRIKQMGTATMERISTFLSRTAALRDSRLLEIAESSKSALREADARAVFTAADIEIHRMEKTLQAMRKTAR